MSSGPLRPVPLQRQHSASSPSPLAQSVRDGGSASSSVTAASQPSRSDQVVHRFYLKTVAVLVEGRLTHYASAVGKNGEKKKDKWVSRVREVFIYFNLTLPEVDLHRSDLQIYRSISSYGGDSPDSFGVPPLLVAFILDTSDLPSGQALMWYKDGAKYTLDPGVNGKGKGKEKDRRQGIVLERWTLCSHAPAVTPTTSASASAMAPHTAYRLGIIHFRALFALVRLLPAYRLFRRLRRTNSGLRLGIKLWGPEGYSNFPEDLTAAWEIMERGLISLDVGLDKLSAVDGAPCERPERYDMPLVDLFGSAYSLRVEYRPDVEFHVEDMESILSEKFNDMDEDWFTPTVAAARRGSADSSTASGNSPAMGGSGGSATRNVPQLPPSRRVSTPTAIPAASTSPIPHRQPAAGPGSFGSSRTSTSRLPSFTTAQARGATPGPAGSAGNRWGSLAEGLPFASPGPSAMPGNSGEIKKLSQGSSPGAGVPPSGAAITARRLSGHSINPINASPSTSQFRLAGTPPGAAQPSPLMRPGSSVGRTSSFLSQSGRSFTHAQLANMSPPVGQAPVGSSPHSPSSLSFSKQPIPRSLSSRQGYVPSSTASPFVPGSLEREGLPAGLPSPSGTSPQIIKRFSSSLSQRQARLGPSGSHSSGDGTSPSHSLLRRTSTRTSQESGLRHSAAIPGPDDDDIQSFLKTLDNLPQPPLVAAQAIHASRHHLPSTSSSLSGPSIPASPSPLHGSGESQRSGGAAAASASAATGSGAPTAPSRAPMTRAQVDDALRKMAGSFNVNTSKLVESTSFASKSSSPAPSAGPTSSGPSKGTSSVAPSPSPSPAPGPAPTPGPAPGPAAGIGLLSASRPVTVGRRPFTSDGLLAGPAKAKSATPDAGPSKATEATSPSQVPLPGSPAAETPDTLTAAATAPDRPAPGQYKRESGTGTSTLAPATARSLPGTETSPLAENVPLPAGPPLSAKSPSGAGVGSGTGTGTGAMAALISPQTTGNSSTTNESRSSRRGPVLLRGGFENRAQGQKQSTSASPSHSPIRDFARLGLGTTNRQFQRTESMSGVPPSAYGQGHPHGYGHTLSHPYGVGGGGGGGGSGVGQGRRGPGQRTAPSSFGGPDASSGLDKDEERGRRVKRGPMSEKGMDEDEITSRTLTGDW